MRLSPPHLNYLGIFFRFRRWMDYLYRIAIQTNSFHNNMVDKMVWWINKYSLYVSFRVEFLHHRPLQ